MRRLVGLSGASKMLTSFLQNTKATVRNEVDSKYVIVLGNEACDLDSIACSTSYAYIKAKEDANSEVVYVPYCSIPQEDFILRTEASFWLNSCDINKDDLFYAGSLNNLFEKKSIDKISLILVDHAYVNSRSCLKDYPVVEIIDHHPLSPGFGRPDTCTYFCVERVGSCASLITDEMVKRLQKDVIPSELCQLLYGAISIDTMGLSETGKQSGRVQEKDISAALKLEDIGGAAVLPNGSNRETIYQQIYDAKFNVSELSIWDLLRRDMKAVGVNPEAPPQIACSTIMGMDYSDLIESRDFDKMVNKFCDANGVEMLVCMTIGEPSRNNRHQFYKPSGSTAALRRGLVVTSRHNKRQLSAKLWQYLVQDSHNLRLELPANASHASTAQPGVYTAIINNQSITRKQIIPILIDYLRLQK